MTGAIEFIPTEDIVEDCGRGHACNFCPQDKDCTLDRERHSQQHMDRRLSKINWTLPVLANKGGVGKSTVSANLALALAGQGYAVGLADADIHGPNAARMFGLQEEKVKVSERGIHAPEYAVPGRGSLRVPDKVLRRRPAGAAVLDRPAGRDPALVVQPLLPQHHAFAVAVRRLHDRAQFVVIGLGDKRAHFVAESQVFR